MKDKPIKRTHPNHRAWTIAMLPRVAILIVAAASVLTGCSGGPSKGQLANAINEVIKEKVCFGLQDKGVPTWPLQVERPLGAMAEQPLDAILVAMQAAGYLKITQVTQKHRTGFIVEDRKIDVITPTEKAKGWWDPQYGFCVGTKAVAEAEEWTDPTKNPVIQVKYTWHLVDVPSWAKGPEFKNIPGMATPVSDTIQLQKTNKGWKAVPPLGGLQ
jgi:hypothetical protein